MVLGQLRESKLTTVSLLEAGAVPLLWPVWASDRRDHIACKVSFVPLCKVSFIPLCKVSFVPLCKVSVRLFSLVWALDRGGHIECKVAAQSLAFRIILTEVLFS